MEIAPKISIDEKLDVKRDYDKFCIIKIKGGSDADSQTRGKQSSKSAA